MQILPLVYYAQAGKYPSFGPRSGPVTVGDTRFAATNPSARLGLPLADVRFWFILTPGQRLRCLHSRPISMPPLKKLGNGFAMFPDSCRKARRGSWVYWQLALPRTARSWRLECSKAGPP